MRRLRILHLAQSFPPAPGGVAEAVYQLSRELVHKGHDVTVATGYHADRRSERMDGIQIKQFQIQGNWVDGMSGDLQLYRDWLRQSQFDVILFYAAQTWTLDAVLNQISEIKGKKILLPCGFSGLSWPRYSKYFENMKTWLRLFDGWVFLSKSTQDYQFCDGLIDAERAFVVRNGAVDLLKTSYDRSEIRRSLGMREDEFVFLHVGSFTGMKGQQSALKIYDQLRLPDASLVLVGDCQSSSDYKKACFMMRIANLKRWLLGLRGRASIRTLPKQQTEQLFQASDLFLFTSQIECSPLVLHECLSAGLPFVTTPAGNSSEIVESTQAGVLLPSFEVSGFVYPKVEESVQLIQRMISQPERLKQMSRHARIAWEDHHRWSASADRLLDCYNRTLG